MADKTPRQIAEDQAERLRINMERAAPGLLPNTLGDAVVALHAAGAEITRQGLIAELLKMAQQRPEMQPAYLFAARHLGSP